MNSLDHLISLRLSEERTRTSSEINDLKSQIRDLEIENKRLLNDQSTMSSEWKRQAGKLSGALEDQANYSKQVYSNLDKVLNKESESIRIMNENSRAMEEHLENVSKANSKQVKDTLMTAFKQFHEEQKDQDQLINSHSEILNFLREKLNLAMSESEEKTPEWVSALNELTEQFSSALSALEERLNEDLDRFQKLLNEEHLSQPRA
jgi:hypothetical protein